MGLGKDFTTLLHIYSHVDPSSSTNSSCCLPTMVTNVRVQLLHTVLIAVVPLLEPLGSLQRKLEEVFHLNVSLLNLEVKVTQQWMLPKYTCLFPCNLFCSPYYSLQNKLCTCVHALSLPSSTSPLPPSPPPHHTHTHTHTHTQEQHSDDMVPGSAHHTGLLCHM